jgi:hypothetical protein
MFEVKKFTASALVGSTVLFAPVAASALTVGIYDTETGTSSTIVDGGAGDLDGVVNGKILLQNFATGSGYVSLETASATESNGTSKLHLNVTDAVNEGNGTILIDVTHTGFGEGAQDPLASSVTFSSNASDVSGEGFSSYGFVNDGNTPGLFYDYPGITVGSGTISSIADDVYGKILTVLSDPFSMTIQTNLFSGTMASFDATLIASIPLPAGGLLLLSALGGLGLARRRRSAEPVVA